MSNHDPSDYDAFGDDEETIVAGDESTLVSTRRAVPQPQLRPTITLRKPALPVRAGGHGIMGFLKPDGQHYNRKLLAAGGLLVIMAVFGVLVLRAISRGLNARAERASSVEEAVAKKPVAVAGSIPLSAGGPPSRGQRSGTRNDFRGDKAAYLDGEYVPEAPSSERPALPRRNVYGEPQSYPTAPRRARLFGIQRTAEAAAPAPSTTPNGAPQSSAFAAAWAKSMAEKLSGMAPSTALPGNEVQPVQAISAPATAAPPPRNTTLALTLIEPVTSGIAAPVRARVASDVKDSSGRVVIPHGSIASVPFLAAEVHGRIPQDRNAPITVTLPDGREMTFRGLVRGADGLPGLTGKVTRAKGGPGFFKRMLGLGGGAASSAALSAAGVGGIVNPSAVAMMAGVDPYGSSIGSSRDASVFVPAGGMITVTVGL